MEIESVAPSVLTQGTQTKSISNATAVNEADIPTAFSDLASSALGTEVLYTTDEFFAAASNLLTPTPAIQRPGVFISTGAFYDGWETRRHNPAPPDYVILRLGAAAGRVAAIEVDTAHFNGNHAEAVSIQGCFQPGGDEANAIVFGWGAGEGGWTSLLSRSPCGPNKRQAWTLPKLTKPITHLRLCMFPDGGIARLRVWGQAVAGEIAADEVVDLAAAVNGGVVVAWTNDRFGPASNILLPGRGKDMGDGWETARSREPGHEDRCVVRLGWRGRVQKIVVDTKDFKGNYPRAIRVEGLDASEVGDIEAHWTTLLTDRPVGPDAEWVFGTDLLDASARETAFQYIKLVMIPDGGIKRFRVFGRRE
ncbi:MAG: hypothetical protein M1825_004197 [Sarcosagium campestre]|nr:MAG: hypothetical protein M1825_004197 [Sarcosagium campestre]